MAGHYHDFHKLLSSSLRRANKKSITKLEVQHLVYTPSSPLLAKISPQAACRPPAGKQRVCKAGGSVAGQPLGTRGTTCPSVPRERADLGHVPAGRLGSQPATPGFSRQVAASTSGTWSGFRNHTSAAVEPESPSHSRLTPCVPL